jgi:hypothetical protein
MVSNTLAATRKTHSLVFLGVIPALHVSIVPVHPALDACPVKRGFVLRHIISAHALGARGFRLLAPLAIHVHDFALK